MKPKSLLLLSAFSLIFFAAPLGAQSINWGNPFNSILRDSDGQKFEDSFYNSYVFELGAFKKDFIHTEENAADWKSNWYTFDRAAYNPAFGYFTSTVYMNDDGSSSFNPLGPSFEGMDAYIWIRNYDIPSMHTEWLVMRADDWIFPEAVPGCCDNEPSLTWAVGLLDENDVPLWGNQKGVEGWGEVDVRGPFDLQTYTFVPEPSSLLLVGLGTGLIWRRRREPAA